VISGGRTLEYASKFFFTTGDPLYSNCSNILLRIIADTCGRHDFLLTPCSTDTFLIIYGDKDLHRGCFGNFAGAVKEFGIGEDMIPTAFSCFTNMVVDGESGDLRVDPPRARMVIILILLLSMI
jgi:uncharacterized protein YcgI (DUF1989 family)